ncbi:MAG: hypothetical protein AB7L84_05440 [Acidimicrobiia bacterium]
MDSTRTVQVCNSLREALRLADRLNHVDSLHGDVDYSVCPVAPARAFRGYAVIARSRATVAA